jgi:hypothetical protein
MPNPYDDTRDRVIRIETKLEHLEEALSENSKTLNEISRAFNNAKFAKTFIVGAATCAGFLASYVPTIAHWLGIKA